jgi:hypothetical protein
LYKNKAIKERRKNLDKTKKMSEGDKIGMKERGANKN